MRGTNRYIVEIIDHNKVKNLEHENEILRTENKKLRDTYNQTLISMGGLVNELGRLSDICREYGLPCGSYKDMDLKEYMARDLLEYLDLPEF